jgi:hypothetical protein
MSENHGPAGGIFRAVQEMEPRWNPWTRQYGQFPTSRAIDQPISLMISFKTEGDESAEFGTLSIGCPSKRLREFVFDRSQDLEFRMQH